MLLPPHEYFALEGRRIAPPPSLLARTIFISAEQPETSHFGQNIKSWRGSQEPSSTSTGGQSRLMRDAGVTAQHLALGYTFRPGPQRTGWASPHRAVFLGSFSSASRPAFGLVRRRAQSTSVPIRDFRQFAT